jgi:hypothetical protein
MFEMSKGLSVCKVVMSVSTLSKKIIGFCPIFFIAPFGSCPKEVTVNKRNMMNEKGVRIEGLLWHTTNRAWRSGGVLFRPTPFCQTLFCLQCFHFDLRF